MSYNKIQVVNFDPSEPEPFIYTGTIDFSQNTDLQYPPEYEQWWGRIVFFNQPIPPVKPCSKCLSPNSEICDCAKRLQYDTWLKNQIIYN